MIEMTKQQQEILPEARQKMAEMAQKFRLVFPSLEVAKLFTGPAVGVLINALGRKKAAEFFFVLAEQIRDGELPQ